MMRLPLEVKKTAHKAVFFIFKEICVVDR